MSEISIPTVTTTAAPAVAAPQAPPALTVCVSCGSAEARAYCPACGQRTRRERLTLRAIARDVAHDVFNLDRGILHTAVALFRHPGLVAAEYVYGRTVRYTGPVKYFLVLAAITTLLYANSGLVESTMTMYGADPAATPAGSLQAQTTEFVTTWLNLIMALGVPFSAVFTRLFFRGVGYNFTEHLIFNTYVYAQACILFLVTMLPVHAAGMGVGTAMLVYMAASLGYTAWAGVQFFRAPMVSGTVRMIAASLLGYAAYMISVLAMGVAVGVAWALVSR